MSQHLCSGGGREMMNLSGGDPLAGVECDMGLEMMLERKKGCRLGARGGTVSTVSLLSR